MKATVNLLTFSDVRTYREWDTEHKFPKYETIDRETIQFEANSLDEAEAYVLTNYPQRCCGYGIQLENGDFIMDADRAYYEADAGLTTMQQILAYKFNMLENRLKNEKVW